MALLYYSTNTWLAYAIAEKYYRRRHYVWCCPHFDPTRTQPHAQSTPPSSSPKDIYWSLYNDVQRGDAHSKLILENRTGLERGASARRIQGTITEDQEHEIVDMVRSAQMNMFRPVLYVISGSSVGRKNIKPVPPGQKAHAFSEEYIIENLATRHFDCLELAR